MQLSARSADTSQPAASYAPYRTGMRQPQAPPTLHLLSGPQPTRRTPTQATVSPDTTRNAQPQHSSDVPRRPSPSHRSTAATPPLRVVPTTPLPVPRTSVTADVKGHGRPHLQCRRPPASCSSSCLNTTPSTFPHHPTSLKPHTGPKPGPKPLLTPFAPTYATPTAPPIWAPRPLHPLAPSSAATAAPTAPPIWSPRRSAHST